ncbi:MULTISPECIES: TIGR03751 family conjugal transfer lipoprotein [Pectobacteriaceae]|uniref:TIGR03751 family conjugal transfer lipoprotein n=3 Tax=Pectobacteriaceae TaxID=1903410 RepID=A0A5J5FR56_9GAMM|nr:MULTISPECIES: TIGR03751 family conjugal transfer lipoprotein [Pectobacteriaceae]MEE3644369.1 TIGR03751 family conjugal transfer lipoprotein [Brenneria sp. L3_3C_1]MEE3651933.1 TIGR03751 family conjugal transfer lipoprotein [Brenneria sp. HEZEL_4_2_4]MEE3663721.1 TIGR03751 family conjugal transfer lipoprotein [Brenneria sp. g21c3]KAA8994701.1 TIGR03751 family conjugal transfer lipoprotein [Affinibrenneria salicis]MBJ7223127.1 TIGR03751 family conjugal transfer lipoprotein [Brenneria sp. L3-3
MKRHFLSLLLLTLAATGCSTSQETLLPVDENTTMLSLWGRQTGDNRTLYDQRSLLRRPLEQPLTQEQQSYTRTAGNEIRAQFRRLPNPDMLMYVYPHLTDGEPTPVPGYSTVFPFYTRVQYAMPGERTEAL